MISKEELDKIRKTVKQHTCNNCYHLPVCKVYSGFIFHLQSISIEEIKAEELAKICPFYMPIMVRGEE